MIKKANEPSNQLMDPEGMFHGVEDFYARYRPPIPSTVVDTILDMCPQRVCEGALLDLGAGTGQVARAFAENFNRIVSVELDANMLERAKKDWASLGIDGDADWVLCDVADFNIPSGLSVSLVTICRSFHWMDQAPILQKYAAQTADQAAVAVFGDSSLWESEQDWAKVTKTCVQSFLGIERKARTKTFKHHRRPYEDIVSESPFSNVCVSHSPVVRQWRPDQVIGYLYSTTFASRELFGERKSEFEQALLEQLEPFVDSTGMLEEQASFKIVVGIKNKMDLGN